jgi:hypothetical protein
MTDQPEVTAVERFNYKEGDRFILHVSSIRLMTEDYAQDLISRFRAAMALPDDAPVVVVDGSFDIEIVNVPRR